MAVKIRLTRMGRKKRPFYRIIVADGREPRDGKYIENLGTYNPITEPAEISVDKERATYWLNQGAQPTDTVKNIFQRQGIVFERYLKKAGKDENQIQEEMKKWEVLQIERKRREEAGLTKKKEEPVKEPEPEKEPKAAEAPEQPEAEKEAEPVKEEPEQKEPEKESEAVKEEPEQKEPEKESEPVKQEAEQKEPEKEEKSAEPQASEENTKAEEAEETGEDKEEKPEN